MKRITLTSMMLVLLGILIACTGNSGGVRCVEDVTSDVSCLGTIGTLDGSQTLTATSDQLESGMWEASVLINVESGSVLVSFTDANGNAVSQEIAQGGTVEGTASIVDGSFEVTLASVDGIAEGISYTISLDELEN